MYDDDKVKSRMKGYWENYQKWTGDANKSFAQKSSAMKARMSAGGVKAGSTQWNTNMGTLESERDSSIRDIEDGVTARELRKWSTQRQEDAYVNSGQGISVLSKEANRRFKMVTYKRDGVEIGMSEYMNETFGALEGSDELTKEQQSTENAKRGASNSTSTGTDSPWW